MFKRSPLTATLITGLSLLITTSFVAQAERSDIETVVANQGPATSQDSKANSDPFYQQLRQQAKSIEDFAAYVSVNNLALKRDAATFTLKSGEIYFSLPIDGRVTAAVFIGTGELTLTPPTDAEKRSLELFTKQPGAMTEEFSTLVLRFTDKTFDEIKNSPNAKMGGSGGTQANRARDLFRDNQQLLRRQLHDNRELRTLADLYAPGVRDFSTPSSMAAAIASSST
jgi:hypothetical protein